MLDAEDEFESVADYHRLAARHFAGPPPTTTWPPLPPTMRTTRRAVARATPIWPTATSCTACSTPEVAVLDNDGLLDEHDEELLEEADHAQ